MRVKFESEEYRWLRVRNKPSKDADVVRMIERGCEFDIDPEPIADDEGNIWYHVTTEPTGYVMAEYVTPIEETNNPDDQTDDGALQKMTVPELRKLAEDSGIALKQGMKKADIIEALLNG